MSLPSDGTISDGNISDGRTAAAEPAAQSAYQRIGGGPAVQAAVEKFYELVLADPNLRGYFVDGADGGATTEKVNLAELRRHLAALLTTVLGGPDGYGGRDLATAHHPLGITGADFDLVADYLEATLLLLHVPRDIIGSTMATVGGLRGEIVGSPAGAT